MGFFTKLGDGAADILPLAGLTKRRVRAVAEHMGAPSELAFKVPTADLESDAPLRLDEEVYGVTYEQIDDFLEGNPVVESAAANPEGLSCERAQAEPACGAVLLSASSSGGIQVRRLSPKTSEPAVLPRRYLW